jgi:hypothetical protein
VAATTGARPLECSRNSALATRGHERERVARPTLVVEVDGEKTAGVVEQQRVDTSDEITSAIVPDAILATQMGFDHLVGDRNERLVRALAATNLRLAANTAHPLVRASWGIAAAAGFRILPSCGSTSVRPANNLRKRAILSAAGDSLVTIAASEAGGEGSCSLSSSRRRASSHRRSISIASSWARMRLASSCRCGS